MQHYFQPHIGKKNREGYQDYSRTKFGIFFPKDRILGGQEMRGATPAIWRRTTLSSRGVLPYISYIGTFRQSGYHFQGPLS